MIVLGDSALDIAIRNYQGDVILLFLTKSLYQVKDLPSHLNNDTAKGNTINFVINTCINTCQ